MRGSFAIDMVLENTVKKLMNHHAVPVGSEPEKTQFWLEPYKIICQNIFTTSQL